jgi:hypothetical protein
VTVERSGGQRLWIRRGWPADTWPRPEIVEVRPTATDRAGCSGPAATRLVSGRRHPASSLATSSAAMLGGNLANSGVGAASFVPGLIGADCQRAAVR